jgi:hypothetical protein
MNQCTDSIGMRDILKVPQHINWSIQLADGKNTDKGVDGYTSPRGSPKKFYSQEQLQLWSSHLEHYTSEATSTLHSINPDHLYSNFSIIEGVQEWSQAVESRMLWVKGVHEAQYPSSASAVAAKVISVALKLRIPTIFFFCTIPTDGVDHLDSRNTYYEWTFIDCIYSLIRQIINVLAPHVDRVQGLKKEHFARLDGSFESLEAALDLLEALFSVAPRTLLVIIDGLDRIAERGFDDLLGAFLKLLEGVLVRESWRRGQKAMVLKALFSTAGPCDALQTIATQNLDIVFASERTPKHLAKRGRILTEPHLIGTGLEEAPSSDVSSDDEGVDEAEEEAEDDE